MSEFRTCMGEDGRVVIPAAYRKQLHLTPGEELIIRLDNNELHLISLKHSIKKAQKLVQKYTKNKSLQKLLKEMRTKDAANE